MRRTHTNERRIIGGTGQLLPPGPIAAPSSPATPLTIFGASVLQWCRSDLGITIGTGVSAWADQSGNGNGYSQGTGGAQPTYAANDATLSNLPSLTFDGVDDALLNTTVNFGAQPQVVILIAKLVTWVGSRVICCADSAASTVALIQNGASPQIRQINNTQTNTNGGFGGTGVWGRVQAEFVGTTADRIQVISTSVTGNLSGTLTGTGYRLGRQGGAATAYSNIAVAEVVLLNAVPSAGQNSQMDAYITARYGAGLV